MLALIFFVSDFITLPALNAILNGCATILLIAGFVCIKQRREAAHRRAMLAAFGVSILFLISYVVYHIQIGGGRKFPEGPAAFIRYAYLTMLASHVLLAMAVPFMAGWTIFLGLKDRRAEHRRWARWTFPIWLYVSVTGVLIYVVLYHVYPM